MKRILKFTFTLSLLAPLFIGCKDKVKLEKMEFNLNAVSPYAEINKTKDKPLKIEYTPSDASNKEVVWTVEDPSIASIDKKTGIITGLKLGVTKVTATSVENPKIFATTEFLVRNMSTDIKVYGTANNKNFIDFEANKAAKEVDDSFMDTTKPYYIGTDNPVCIKPQVLIFDGDGRRINQEKWEDEGADKIYDCQVTKEDGTMAVEGDDFIVSNPKKCYIKFNKPLGNVKINVTIKTAERFKQTMDVCVINGYNIQSANELSVMDQRPSDEPRPADADEYYDGCDYAKDAKFSTGWIAFKNKNNIPLPSQVTSTQFIIHGNIELKKENIPANFFYTAEELKSYGCSDEEIKKSAGSLKDVMRLYKLYNKDYKLFGNYFKISLQRNISTSEIERIPLVKRESGKASGERVDSHSFIFSCLGGSLEINDLNVTGNYIPANLKKEGGISESGCISLIMYHNNNKSVSINNTLMRKLFMTVQKREAMDGARSNLSFNKSKLSENYNTFIYNSGCVIEANDCRLQRCGGPFTIEDHIMVSAEQQEVVSKDTQTGKWKIEGRPSSTSFNNCDMENLCDGTEGWFIAFGAEAIIPIVHDIAKYVTDQSHFAIESKNYAASFIANKDGKFVDISTEEGSKYFNFFGLGKNDNMTGPAMNMAISPIQFKDKDTTTLFNYGYWKDASLVDNQPKDENEFNTFRAIETNPAAPVPIPLVQTNGGYGYYIPTQGIFGFDGNLLTPESDFFTKASGYLALYIMGILVTFKLGVCEIK